MGLPLEVLGESGNLNTMPQGAPLTEGLRAGLQAVMGCVGASGTGNCASGALSAASSVVIGNLLNIANETTGEDLSPEAREQAINIVASLSGSIVGALGGDVNAAVLAARVEAENNQLSTTPLYYVGPDGKTQWLVSKVAATTPSGKLVWVRPDEIPSDLDPTNLVAIGADLLGFSSNEGVAKAGAAIGLLNDPSYTNIALTVIPVFVRQLAKPINVGTAAFDIGNLGVQTIDNAWLQIQWGATYYKPVFDQYGNPLTLPNVQSVDYWNENPCLYTGCH